MGINQENVLSTNRKLEKIEPIRCEGAKSLIMMRYASCHGYNYENLIVLITRFGREDIKCGNVFSPG